MIEKTLTHYDYLALQVYWEGTKNFSSRTPLEQSFLTNFFYKYQVLVLSEDDYRRDDKVDRIEYILSNMTDISLSYGKIDSGSIPSLRKAIIKSFNNDIFILTNLSKKQIPEQPQKISNTLGPEVAVMGMMKQEHNKEIRKAIENEYKSLSKDARTQLFEELDVKTKKEAVDRIDYMVRRQEIALDTALQNQLDKEEKLAIRDTNTQLDGESLIEGIKVTKQVQKDVVKLLEKTLGGQSWDQVTLKELPKWFKMKVISGIKRLAITTVLLPIKGPTALINGVVITPLKIVYEDITSLTRILQRIMGWTMVCFMIAGICVVMYNPEYDDTRKRIIELYSTGMEYVPATIFEPTKKTVQILLQAVPGQKFFADVFELMKNFAVQIPGYIIGWFGVLFQALMTAIKDVITSAVSSSAEKLTSWRPW